MVIATPHNEPDKKYNIIDFDFHINLGHERFTLQKLPENEVAQYANSFNSFTGNASTDRLELHKIIPTIDLKQFFSIVDWKRALHEFLNQGADKDMRIVHTWKSVFIAHSGHQSRNNHVLMFTNSGTGKSTFGEILGNFASNEASIAGLLGSIQNGFLTRGELSGDGNYLFLDEINSEKTDVVKPILTYLEQGKVSRSLVQKVECEGTKCILMAGNPEIANPDFLAYCFRQILFNIGAEETPQRIGKRFGILLFGNDFTNIDPSISSDPHEDPDGDLIRAIVGDVNKLYKSKIAFLYESLKKTFDFSVLDYYVKECIAISKRIDDSIVSGFVEGFSWNIKRVLSAGFREWVLDNLPLIVLEKNEDCVLALEKEIVDYVKVFADINLTSLRNLPSVFPSVDSYDDFVKIYKEDKELRDKNTKVLSRLFSKSVSSIERYIKRYDEDRNAGTLPFMPSCISCNRSIDQDGDYCKYCGVFQKISKEERVL